MSQTGTLYIVATPIGNLGDISRRALDTLGAVNLVAAEDTRRCRQLLEHFGIRNSICSYHDHSAGSRGAGLLEKLQQGQSVALVSDAGTPLIADPGFVLVAEARRVGITVVPIPGPCAAVTALSVAGLPCDRFTFEGFLPARTAARQSRLQELGDEVRTMVFYEAPHRILEMLEDCVIVLGPDRRAVLARELSKRFETVLSGVLGELRERVADDADQRRGELVILIAGRPHSPRDVVVQEGLRVLEILSEKLSMRDAVALSSRISGCSRNLLYKAALDSESGSES